MDNTAILNLRNTLNKYGVIMSFTGPFSQGIIEEIGDALRNYLETQDNSRGDIFKVFSVFIEQTQNIKNYAYGLSSKDEQEKILLSGILNIGVNQNNTYFVSSGNLIKKSDASLLKEKLDKINSLNKKELARVYRKKLLETNENEKGAGLGLIEMARKASEKIIYNFDQIEDDFYFFTLIINL